MPPVLNALCSSNGMLSQANHQDLLIKVVTLGGRQHKVAAYADDLLILISNPDTAITQKQIIQLLYFSSISTFKMNANKSQILGMSIPSPKKDQSIK